MSKEHISLNIVSVVAMPLIFMVGTANADPYRWCAVNSGPVGTNCGFVTLEQCQATISGLGGSCELNQFYTGRPAPVGHRQPKVKDLPADVLQREEQRLPSGDKEYDKRMNICEGC